MAVYTKACRSTSMLLFNWSRWRDSNSRPSAPKADALPRLRYTEVIDDLLHITVLPSLLPLRLPHDSSPSCMAGDEGVEPPNGGIKIRCLRPLDESPTDLLARPAGIEPTFWR